MILWVLTTLGAVLCIQWVEYANRHVGDGTLGGVILYTLPAIVAGQVCLFYTFRDAPHWLAAWAMLSLFNAVLRLVLVHYTDTPIDNWTLALCGTAAILMGGVIIKEALG